MTKTCPSCNAEIAEVSTRGSTWVPFLAAVGMSAAALLVYNGVRKAKSPKKTVENALATCSRAASALDRRLGDFQVRIAS